MLSRSARHSRHSVDRNRDSWDCMPNDLENAEPIYTEFKGWKQELTTTNFADLPKEIKDYIEFIEKETGVPVKIVSVGPDRNKTIFR